MTETQWLRTADGLVRSLVVKAFQFNVRAGVARGFTVGEHLLDPNDPEDAAVLAHRSINTDFADGHIERPEATLARLQAAEAAAAERAARQAAVRKEAESFLGGAT